jgi:hypothetical protein
MKRNRHSRRHPEHPQWKGLVVFEVVRSLRALSLPNPQTYTEMADTGNEMPIWGGHGFNSFASIARLTSQ